MKEEDIRKRDIFNKYLELVRMDVESFFDLNTFEYVLCPACEYTEYITKFSKNGFRYVMCKRCETIYVNPRPPFDVLRRFYHESKSTTYFVREFFTPVSETRRIEIFKPRAEYLNTRLKRKEGMVIGDIGAGFGLFLEEMRKIIPNNKYIAIEPSREMANICLAKALEVRCVTLEELEGGEKQFDVLTSFELAEHLHTPSEFFGKARNFLKDGGCLIATTLNGKGFDLALLEEHSKSISPPHHLNFFNPSSSKLLFERLGFKNIEITTPGKLDWDIVEGMIKNEGVDIGRFWKQLVYENTSVKAELQDWISRNGLSSHMMILAKR